MRKKKHEEMLDSTSEQQPISSSPQPENGGLPLFFRSPAPIDMQRHKDAGIVPVQDVSFAADVNALPLNIIEFMEASQYYPIVFTLGQDAIPIAVTGLEQRNYFINRDGSWKENTYIPAYVRKYPFIFMDIPESDQLLLCIDEAAPHYISERETRADALPFYNGEEPSELTRNALEFCKAFHQHNQLSQRFCKALNDAGLLSPMHSTTQLYNGREIQLAGFQVIDEKKFNELPDEIFMQFRRDGWLPFIYYALLSSTKWPRLVDLAADIEKKTGF